MKSLLDVFTLQELGKKYTILFVEDSIALQKQVNKFLSKVFKKVYIASNGLEGVELFENNKIDIILTDLTMPLMSGHEMIEEIKKINIDVEIIILSAHSDHETLMKSFHVGVSDFITKPVNAQKMIDVFNKVLNTLENKRKNHKNVIEKSTHKHEILTFLYENNTTFDLINYYKGVPIINSAKIIEIDDKYIIIRTNQLQLLAIKNEKKTIIDTSLINKDVLCSLVQLDFEKYQAILKVEEFFFKKQKDKNHSFIEVDNSIRLYLKNDEKRQMLNLMSLNYEELIININSEFNFKKHDTIEVLLVIDGKYNNNSAIHLNIQCNIFSIKQKDDYTLQAVLLIKNNDKIKRSLNNYILKREAELVEEFKNIMKI